MDAVTESQLSQPFVFAMATARASSLRPVGLSSPLPRKQSGRRILSQASLPVPSTFRRSAARQASPLVPGGLPLSPAGPFTAIRLPQHASGASRGGALTAMASVSSTTALVYGGLLLVGGVAAYVRTGSKGSLGGGLTGAAVMALAFFLLQSAESESLGNSVGFGGGLLFCAVFAIRLFSTGKLVPAGPLLALSTLATALFASAYFS